MSTKAGYAIDFEKLALDLAKFIKALHKAKCENATPSSMGRDIKLLNNDFLENLKKMDRRVIWVEKP